MPLFGRLSAELDLQWHLAGMRRFGDALFDACYTVFSRADMRDLILDLEHSDVRPGSPIDGACAILRDVTVRVPWEMGPGKLGIDARATANALYHAFVAAGVRCT